MSRCVWLPFASIEEAEEAVGPIPEGLRADCFLVGQEWPESIGEVELLVAPYLDPVEAVMERAGEMTKLRVIQLQTAGFETYLPLLPAGVTLCNAAGVHDTSTAELAIALALVNNRHLDTYARNMPAGVWAGGFGESLADHRVLIVGYGHIGRAIEARVSAFEVAGVTRVASTARIADGRQIHGIDELPALLPDADIVFLTTPLTPATRHLIGARELALLPRGALVVNVSRGPVVDTDALVAALNAGQVRASMDVTDPEPLPADHPLWHAPGAFISPHVGGASSAFYPRSYRLIREQLRRFAAGEPLANVIVAGD